MRSPVSGIRITPHHGLCTLRRARHSYSTVGFNFGFTRYNIMTLTYFLLTVAVLVGGLALTIAIGRTRFDRTIRDSATSLLVASEGPKRGAYSSADLRDLPPPIERYLNHVLPEVHPHIETVRLDQSGTFRSGDAHSRWNPFTAVQHVTTYPPGFVWDATIQMLPGLPVRVVDQYRNGRGLLRAKLAGVVSVVDADPGPALDEAELLRYLAETPLYPTALLSHDGLRWTAIDDSSARATLKHQGTTASLVFHVNDKNEVERVSGQRAYLNEDSTSEYRAWTGDWWNYQSRAGMRVPTDGKVAWIQQEGAFCYWRGHIETIQYQFATAENGLEDPPERHQNGGEQRSSILQTSNARASSIGRKTRPKIQSSKTSVPESVLAIRPDVGRP